MELRRWCSTHSICRTSSNSEARFQPCGTCNYQIRILIFKKGVKTQ
jgi:hypothetical protein